jgi:NAD(P)H dehydrogenase (quinone)
LKVSVTDLPDLAITGSTGAVGGRTARRLADAGIAQRLLVRNPAEAPSLPGAVPVAISDYGDGEAMTGALAGVSKLFLVSFREASDRLQRHIHAVDAAVAAGVERIVYLSFLEASADSTFALGRQHFATEEHIRETGLGFVFLRSSFYADFVPYFTRDDGVIRAPAGDGRVSWISRDDIAHTVAVAIQTEEFDGQALENTGPAALAWESRRPTGAPDWEIEGWVTSYLAIGNGELSTVSDTVERLTEHPPVDVGTFLRSNPGLWTHLAG